MNPLARFFQLAPLGLLRVLARLAALGLKSHPQNPTKLRSTIRTNLILAFPELAPEDRLRLEDRTISYLCLTAVESLKSWVTPPLITAKRITQVVGEEHLLEALKSPTGLIAIVPHMGNWEVMNTWASQLSSPTIMYKPESSRLLNQMMLAGRQQLSANLVPTDSSGIKAIFKEIKNGGFTVILPDHTPSASGGVLAPFFGIDTLTTTLVGKLASKTQCQLIALSCIRQPNGEFTLYCDPLDDPALWSKQPTTQAAAMNQVIQRMISRAPEQYIWNYERFRRGDPKLNGVYNWSYDSARAMAVRSKSNQSKSC